MILRVRTLCRVLCQTCALHFLYFLQGRYVDAVGIINPARGIGAGHRLAAKLLRFLDRVDRHVARAGHSDRLAFDILAVALKHFLCQIKQTIACCFRSCKRAAVSETFTCQHAFIQVADSLILSEHKTDLAAANADITRRHVGVRADMSAKFCHKALAERHHLSVGFSLRIEIRAALAAADWQTRQGIFENLLKAQEFDDTQVYGRMET